jgi:hypothetical protein
MGTTMTKGLAHDNCQVAIFGRFQLRSEFCCYTQDEVSTLERCTHHKRFELQPYRSNQELIRF